MIRWDEDERLVHIESYSAAVWRELARQGFSVLVEIRDRSGSIVGKRYVPIPRGDFRWGKRPARSPAQVEAARKGAFKRRNHAKAAPTRNRSRKTRPAD